MDTTSLRKLLQDVRKGTVSPDDAVARMRHMPFEDLGFAKIDHHRRVRSGMPEVIFAQGKTPAQVAKIFKSMAAQGGNVLATKATAEHFRAVKKLVRKAEYRELAQAITLQQDSANYGKGVVVIISAGTSDIPVAEEALVTAEIMGNEVAHLYDVGVAGIHRLLAGREMFDKAQSHYRVRRHGRRAAKCCWRAGASAGHRRADQHWLWRFIQRPGSPAGHAQLLRFQRERGEY